MNLRDEVRDVCSVGITAHEKPDGDAVGASLSLAMYLEKLFAEEGREVRIDVFLEPYPQNLQDHIPGARFLCKKEDALTAPYDVFFAVDTGIGRTGEAEELVRKAKKRLNIDHHASNPGEAEVCEIDKAASSTCELLYRLMEKPLIDHDIAQALYVGLITDTGCFKYSNTGPESLRMAADLLRFGFDFAKIVQETFFERTFLQQKILGKVLSESTLYLDGRLIVGTLTRAALQELGARREDIEGVSSDLKLTAGTHCAVFLHEDAENSWRVSLRSDERVNVASVAEHFDGGGHVRAAGCKVQGALKEVLPEFLRLIAEEMGKTGE